MNFAGPTKVPGSHRDLPGGADASFAFEALVAELLATVILKLG